MIKKNQVESDYGKLKRIARNYLDKGNYRRALETIQVLGNFMYNINLFYKDEDVEQMIKEISSKLIKVENFTVEENNKILFFDGFGLDTRGLALIYIKALVDAGFEVIYVTPHKKELNIPSIKKVLKTGKGRVEEIPATSVYEGIKHLHQLINIYKIRVAFLYTLPSDMIGIPVFTAYSGKIIRYMINLTDHAFWLGKYAFDYLLEFRDYGASVSIEKRNIEEDRILKQPYYPCINEQAEFEGFPFDENGHRVVFSGGSLYKTFGGENRYYKIVDHILKKYSDTIFLYAGFGNGEELVKLNEKYKNRVFWINERKDLYQIMKHSYIYLSTYPMIGGLMTQYAVAAGTVPFTLVYDDCATGILLSPDLLKAEYKDYDSFIKNLDCVFDDERELENRKRELAQQLISVEMFEENLKNILLNHNSQFPYVNEHVETERFQSTYLERMTLKTYCSLFLKRDKLFLYKYYPIKCSVAVLREIKERLCR